MAGCWRWWLASKATTGWRRKTPTAGPADGEDGDGGALCCCPAFMIHHATLAAAAAVAGGGGGATVPVEVTLQQSRGRGNYEKESSDLSIFVLRLPRGPTRARSHCRFGLRLIRFIPDSLRYSVPLFLKRQCDRTLGPATPLEEWELLAAADRTVRNDTGVRFELDCSAAVCVGLGSIVALHHRSSTLYQIS